MLALPTLAAVAIRGEPKGGVSFTVITLVVMLLVRRVVGDRERRAQIAERERDLVAREAVVEERARIARELHDVIAHHVSMIVLQAGAERRVLDGANASTREVLETVERTGRSALTEMRRLLGMLRGDANEPLTPQPGLDRRSGSRRRSFGKPAFPSSSMSRASGASFRSGSSCPPTGSCKRR